jgi:hypothetical protein
MGDHDRRNTQLAEIMGIEALVATKRIPLPDLADVLIVRKGINAEVGRTGYFASIRESPGTARAVLASLTEIKKAGIAPEDLAVFASLDAFATLAEDLLTERLPATDVYRSGHVVVSSLGAARGLSFKLLLIPGLVERSFP